MVMVKVLVMVMVMVIADGDTLTILSNCSSLNSLFPTAPGNAGVIAHRWESSSMNPKKKKKRKKKRKKIIRKTTRTKVLFESSRCRFCL